MTYDWNKIVETIDNGVGGESNISKVYHCATRFRVVVKDVNLVQKEELEKIDIAKGVNVANGEVQIIFGAGLVNKVFEKYQASHKNGANASASNEEMSKTFKWNPNSSFKDNLFLNVRAAIRAFAEIFIPLIPIFIAGGISLALESFIGAFIPSNAGSSYRTALALKAFFSLIGGGILGSLPAFVGYTAMKKYGGTPLLGLAIGIIMVAPSLMNSWSQSDFVTINFGAEVPVDAKTLKEKNVAYTLFPESWGFFNFSLIGYQAQVVPVLMIVYLGYWLEKLAKRFSHESVAILTIPLVTVIGSVFFGFWLIGPIGRYLSDAIGWLFKNMWTYTNFPFFGLGGALIAFVYPFLVITGLHQGFLPIEALLVTETTKQFGHGFTWITPIATVSNIAQGMVGFGILIAILMLKKDKQVSKVSSSAISANLGITEPALFGVNLPLKYPLLIGAIASAVGGFWLGMSQTYATSQGSASWLGNILQFSWKDGEAEKLFYAKLDKDLPWNYVIHTSMTNGVKMLIGNLITSVVAVSATVMWSLTKGKKELLKWAA
ncbi:PTS transporter subunit EIIC [Mycoplasmopsis gallinacea]|uniref:PTS transporter subunit EIIC n=1 Tax=Mycoplasmopsis gallinacea TaxID=29556 RepID=A0A6H0V3W5_9BACT|nr:PTS transporter subunit EIIC [Mycoplasmopsis gallinacea]QIW62424.1 PTS transporter subunit EIIC [Mycoplasmopsis gallinacea]